MERITKQSISDPGLFSGLNFTITKKQCLDNGTVNELSL